MSSIAAQKLYVVHWIARNNITNFDNLSFCFRGLLQSLLLFQQPETLSDVVTSGVNGNNNQPRNTGRNAVSSAARIVDRSEHIFDPETAAELSSAEIEGLTYMREEEKLARDVYLVSTIGGECLFSKTSPAANKPTWIRS